jgi:hypothetical protein
VTVFDEHLAGRREGAMRRGCLLVVALLVASMGVTEQAATAASAGPLARLYGQVSRYSAADYTASFSARRDATARAVHTGGEDATALRQATDGLVMVRGLKNLVADYRTRVATDYTAESWYPFAKALVTASGVSADASASASRVADAKTALMTAAAGLKPVGRGSFQTITNDTFWTDTDGNPIYSQGGGVFKFGDTYYWYGVHYVGAEDYRANPTRKYDKEVTFVSIPVYSSKDLAHWKFENNVATQSTSLPDGTTLGQAGWVGRLGVVYNENTGKYVLVTQGPGGILFLVGDSPTDNFVYGNAQSQVVNSPTPGTGDQTIFTDDNGRDYLVFSNASGRAHAFVAELRESDSLAVEPAVEIGYNPAGREGNAMFKLDGRYYMAASDLHGWNSSVTHVIESTTGDIQGAYSSEFPLSGTEMDYSHVTQSGFFVTVKGTRQTTVIFAGDRWADFAWNGTGYNQWMPVSGNGAKPQSSSTPEFHSLSQWQFNATTGEWRVGPANNYILNPEFAADRIIVPQVTGWTNVVDPGSASALVTNVKSGANSTQYALRIGTTEPYSGGVRQQIEVPAGVYTLSLAAKTSGLPDATQVTIADACGHVHTFDLPSSSDWTSVEFTGIPLPAGTATVTVRASSGTGGPYLFVDALQLRR